MRFCQILNAIALAGAIATLPSLSTLAEGAGTPDRWWGPDEGRTWPRRLDYANTEGAVGVLRDGAPLDTRGRWATTGGRGQRGSGMVATCGQRRGVVGHQCEPVMNCGWANDASVPLDGI